MVNLYGKYGVVTFYCEYKPLVISMEKGCRNFHFFFQDAVRILLLQFSALLVEHASQHIHDAANK